MIYQSCTCRTPNSDETLKTDCHINVRMSALDPGLCAVAQVWLLDTPVQTNVPYINGLPRQKLIVTLYCKQKLRFSYLNLFLLNVFCSNNVVRHILTKEIFKHNMHIFNLMQPLACSPLSYIHSHLNLINRTLLPKSG